MIRAWLSLLFLAGCATPPPEPSPLLPPGVVGGTVTSGEKPVANVFVYVKTGLEGRRFDVPKEPVVLDQHHHEFVPCVLGVRAGQPPKILSSDHGIHNVNCVPFNNPGFNESLLMDESMTKVFLKSEVMIQLRCNLHSMTGRLGVLDHPYFTVTGDDGRFELRGLPPGDYTIEAWYEYSGARQQRVQVGTASAAPFRLAF